MCEIALDIKTGDVFESFEEVNNKILTKSQENYVQLYKKEAKTVSSVTKTTCKRYLNPSLIYYHVTWACVFGGRVFKSRGHGIRKSRTLRKEDVCKAQISIRISSCGNKFVVIKVNNVHNHVVNQSLFKQLPQRRKLPIELKEDTKKLLALKVNKQLLKEQLENKLQKNITLKDLSNLQCEAKSGYTNDIRIACEKVQTKFGADCHLLINENDMFRGLMFCTNFMRKSFEAYPEFLCVDGTYKLLNIRAPVYLMLVEDGNGESMVICVAILVQEDAESLEWLFESFKILNPHWNKIKTVMTDKDLTERDIISKCFPNVTLQLCIFHVLKIFSSEITCDKYSIMASEKNIILDFLQKLVYCKTNDEFLKYVDIMKESISDKVFKYLEHNWLDIKEQWCPYLAQISSNFLNTTNNRLEGINSQLKKVISKNSSLEEFLEKLFSILRCLKEEQDYRLADHLNKRCVGIVYSETERNYKNLLSPYAFDKMCNQFNFASEKIIEEEGILYCYSKNSKDVKYTPKPDSCDCYFYVSMQLPCKHIFALRQHLNQDTFDPSIVNERWKIEYVIKNSSLFTNLDMTEVARSSGENIIEVISTKPKKVYSQQEKFRILFVKCKLLASLGAEAQSKDFTNVCCLLDGIISELQQNNYNINIVMDKETYNVDTVNIETPEINAMMNDNIEYEHNITDNTLTQHDLNLQPIDDKVNMSTNYDIDSENMMIEYSQNDVTVQNEYKTSNLTSNEDVHNNDVNNTFNTGFKTGQQPQSQFNMLNLSSIKVFPAKCRGRPKGRDKTVIGLKKRKHSNVKLFEKKSKLEKKKIILSWILKDTTNLRSLVSNPTDIKPLEDIDVRLLEVNISIIRDQFYPDMWSTIKSIKKRLSDNAKWICPVCNQEIAGTQPSVKCDSCLYWLHIEPCITNFQRNQKYICNQCL